MMARQKYVTLPKAPKWSQHHRRMAVQVNFNVVIPPNSGDCKVKVGVYGFSAAYRRAAPASVTANKCTFNSLEKCLMCPYDDLEVRNSLICTLPTALLLGTVR